jgi:hypothetical protein
MSTPRSFAPSCTVGQSWRTTACLCACHLGGDCDDAVCAQPVTRAAVLPPLPAVRLVHGAPSVASSHRTERTARPISTPLGVTRRFSV